MEKQYTNEDYAGFILEKLIGYNKIGFTTSAYIMACECIDYYEDRVDLTYHDKCSILAVAYDLMEHLQKQGYYSENIGMYTQVNPIQNLEIGCVTYDTSFKFELSEKLEK